MLVIGDTVEITYATGGSREVKVEWQDEEGFYALAGKTSYYLRNDGVAERLRIAADGGTILAATEVGRWEP